MVRSMMRAASKVVMLTGLALVAASIAACSSASDSQDESTGSAEGAMGCRPGTVCGEPAPACDPATSCCFQGSQAMGASQCGWVLYNAGCRSTRGTAKAFAIEADGFNHWWFEVYCPASAGYVVNDWWCQQQGIHFNFGGNNCTVNQPPAGKVDVVYDPNCPSGCSLAVQ